MFEKALPRKTKNILALLAKSQLLKDAYLADGTTCALHLGHRISYDLDFFAQRKFNSLSLANKLSKIKGFKLEKTAWGTILGQFGKIRFSLFYYSYPLLHSPKIFHGLKIADLRDIAAMKVTSIAEGGTKRDFVDLYFICQKIPPSRAFRDFWLYCFSMSIKQVLILFSQKNKPKNRRKGDFLNFCFLKNEVRIKQ
jgi:hypothetical protein